MTLKKRATGIGMASALTLAAVAPTAQAAGQQDVFGNAGEAQRLQASELAETEAEALCGGACIATGLFVGGLAVGGVTGYLVNQ